MRWKQFFGMMSDDQRREAAAALRSVNEQTRQADANQQTQVVVISAAEVRKSTAQMHVEQARRGAEAYAKQRNQGGGLSVISALPIDADTSLAEVRRQAELYAEKSNRARGAQYER